MRCSHDAVHWLSMVMAASFAFEADAVAQPAAGPLDISKVSFDTKAFDPSKGEKVTLRFEINRQADVLVSFYDRLGWQVWQFNQASAGPGLCTVVWDGRRSDGTLPTGNVFLFTIEAKTTNSEKTIFNRADDTGGLEVKPQTYTFDNKTGKMEYVLPKACMIRLRAGLKESMLAKTLIDWEPRTAGRHVEEWDGKDASGMMTLLTHPDLELRLTCYSLPDNTIITTGERVSLASEKGAKGGEQRVALWSTKEKYLHYGHDPRICHEPKFKVLFPDKNPMPPDGVPTARGVAAVRVELDSRDVGHLTNVAYEIMFFVDGVFVFESEEGMSPFTFQWDTRGLTKGPHALTVNIMSYDDHVGVLSQKVNVEN